MPENRSSNIYPMSLPSTFNGRTALDLQGHLGTVVEAVRQLADLSLTQENGGNDQPEPYRLAPLLACVQYVLDDISPGLEEMTEYCATACQRTARPAVPVPAEPDAPDRTPVMYYAK